LYEKDSIAGQFSTLVFIAAVITITITTSLLLLLLLLPYCH